MLGVPSFPAYNSPQRQDNGRNKVALKPGRSLMDWIRLANSPFDVQGFVGKNVAVPMEELKKHNKETDCWIAVHGKVYNITHYLEYHPGGIPELMRGAGKDATDLFDEVHKWVNISSMLQKCYIGPLQIKHATSIASRKKESSLQPKNGGFLAPTGLLPSKPNEVIPRYDWYDRNGCIVLSIYTKSKVVHTCDIIMDCKDGQTLNVKVLLGEKYYLCNLLLHESIKKASLQSVTGNKIDIFLKKSLPNNRWNKLGNGLDGHNQLHLEKQRELKFRSCTITSIDKVTHDTNLFTIELPPNVYYETPIGHHVIIKSDVQGMEISRNYTVAASSLQKKTLQRENKLHIMIKHYPDGALTPVLHALNQGDQLCMSDCVGSFNRKRLENARKIYMIAAGTGFTPMIRIINYFLSDKEHDSCQLHLLFSNKTENDILWKEQIDDLVALFPEKFHVQYILSKPSESWNGLKGRINKEHLMKLCSPSTIQATTSAVRTIIVETATDRLFAICGPDDFTNSMKRLLLDISIKEENIHCFLG